MLRVYKPFRAFRLLLGRQNRPETMGFLSYRKVNLIFIVSSIFQ